MVPLNILLTEDNLVNQKVAIGLLKQIGYKADIAQNGVEALAALEKASYDVVLMDIQMPEMDGLEATRQIRQKWSHTTPSSPYIIAMTANAMEGDRERCLEVGMDDYLAKPVKAYQLQGALEKAIELCQFGKKVLVGLANDLAVQTRGTSTATDGFSKEVFDVDETLEPAQLNQGSLNALKNLQIDGDEGFLSELIHLFLEDAVVRCDELDRSSKENRIADFTRAAHSIKGASANFGATDLSALCAQIEALGREGNLTEATPLLPNLRKELKRVEIALKAEIGES